jgi:hypothetical protein
MQLFQQPEVLLTRFTKPQLEEGFWAVQGPNLDCSASRIIDDSDLPLSVREECIRSMFDLFKHLFSKEPLDTSVRKAHVAKLLRHPQSLVSSLNPENAA